MKSYQSRTNAALAAFALFASLTAAQAAPLGGNSQCEPAGDWNQTDAYRSINGIPAGDTHECQYEYRSSSSGTPAYGMRAMEHGRSQQ